MSSLPIVFWEASKITVSFALFICLLKTAGDYYMGRQAGSDLNPLLYFLAPVKDIVIGLIWFVPKQYPSHLAFAAGNLMGGDCLCGRRFVLRAFVGRK
jgi:hypothetical protein